MRDAFDSGDDETPPRDTVRIYTVWEPRSLSAYIGRYYLAVSVVVTPANDR